MTFATLDPWITLAREWQTLLAGVLAVLASVIIAIGLLLAAKVHAVSPSMAKRPENLDLRTIETRGWNDIETLNTVRANLEKLRSLLRSALSSLSSIDPHRDAAILLCTRIAAFQWKHFPLPTNADKEMRETYALLFDQFEMLRIVLEKEWSPSQASAILIQLNAHARALSSIIIQPTTGEPTPPWHKNNVS